jgi:hypothetical protein
MKTGEPMTKFLYRLMFISTVMIINSSCGGGGGSISVLPTTDAFDETELDFSPEMDILWVVDPSRSMKAEIETVQNNIQDFIGDFITKGYDYRMGVISTAAWSHQAYLAGQDTDILDGGGGTPLFARLHRGDCTNFANLGDAVLSPSTASDIGTFINKFKTNFDVYGIALDTSGCGLDFFSNFAPVPGNIFASYNAGDRSELSVYVGDERPLQSLQTFLEADPGFLRPNAYLAVIIISDEVDGSRDSLLPSLTFAPNIEGQAPIAGNHTAAQYRSFLSGLKGGNDKKFGIFSIVNQALPGINISAEAAGAENTFDINAERSVYISNLNKIRGEILTSATTYPLGREPIVSTIAIQIIGINGLAIDVPKSTGPGVEGWTYDPNNGEFGSIAFIGTQYTPAQGDGIIIDYTPKFLSEGQVNDPYLLLSNNRVQENSIDTTVVGTVSQINRTIGPADVAVYSIDSAIPAGYFSIDPSTGVITVDRGLNDLDAESISKHQLTVKLNVTKEDLTTYELERVFTISVTDVPDVAPQASDFEIVVSESTSLPNGNIVINGNVTFYVSSLDASEVHTYELVGGPIAGMVFNSNGSFTYTVNRASLGLSIGNDYELPFQYQVTGTNLVTGEPIPGVLPATDTDVANANIKITAANNIPTYLSVTNPINGGNTITPNNDGIAFGQIPLVETDVTVTGAFTGSIADFIGAGNANLYSGADANLVHEINITFPDSDLYEVSCVRLYRDGSSSLGNMIYQIQTGGGSSIPISREVFPVGLTGNSNRPVPANAQGACATLSSSYFTVYTDRDYIGGKLRMIRPFGAKNPQGDSNIKLDRIQVFGTEARFTEIDLFEHFEDDDIIGGVNGNGDTLTFYVTDAFGEGPAPGWASIVGTQLRLLPSASVNDTLGILAVDVSGAEAFTTIKVVGSGGGTVSNAPPISLLKLDDTKRGGLSMRRWGGSNTTASCTVPGGKDNLIVHSEIDNFIESPFSASSLYYDIADTGLNPEQAPHMGDIRSGETENGWCSATVHEDDKYPTASTAFCSSTNFNTAGNIGKIIPCINAARSYGEIYSGYFVPAVTGVYKFRTKTVDNTTMLRIAPTEYHEDTTRIFLANWVDGNLETALRSLINYPTEDLGSSAAQNSEFAGSGTGTSLTNYRAIPYDTNIFFDLNGIPSASNYNNNYTKGYMYMTQGNVYAFEMRFGEGGGAVVFNFEFNRKDLDSSTWDGWAAMDASVVVPDRGLTTAHSPFLLPIGGGNIINFESKDLFYDAELDLLEYSARLVNSDGTIFGTGKIADIGLNIGLLSGTLGGTLNATFTSLPAESKPRVVFRATERFGGAFAESLPIKFE